MEEAKIRGYTDPRTGEYKRATEANREEVLADLGFILAWKYYWDGPQGAEDAAPIYERETWIISDERQAWLDDLDIYKRTMLLDCPPPEEVPAAQAKMVRARIPELGERVQMGKFATAFRGVWGQVIKIDFSPPSGTGVLKATGGVDHTEIFIMTGLSYGGKRVVIKASPYELEGSLLDERPIMARR